MQILITGGTGLIGRSLCARLLKAGHDLTVLSRRPKSVSEKCGANVKAIQSLNEWHPDKVFDAVINLAGEPIIDKAWTAQRKQQIWDSRVKLTEELVRKIAQAKQKPKVFLSGSATGYYGNVADKIVDESTRSASDFGALLCTAWEKAALKAANQDVRVCLLRTGLVLHPDGGLLSKLLLPFALGLGARIGQGKQWMSWIHIDDYVALLVALLEQPDAIGPYNMTAPHPVTNAEFTTALANTLRSPSFFVVPAWLMQLILGQRAYLLLGGQQALPVKAEKLGYRFQYPDLKQALRTLIPLK